MLVRGNSCCHRRKNASLLALYVYCPFTGSGQDDVKTAVIVSNSTDSLFTAASTEDQVRSDGLVRHDYFSVNTEGANVYGALGIGSVLDIEVAIGVPIAIPVLDNDNVVAMRLAGNFKYAICGASLCNSRSAECQLISTNESNSPGGSGRIMWRID